MLTRHSFKNFHTNLDEIRAIQDSTLKEVKCMTQKISSFSGRTYLHTNGLFKQAHVQSSYTKHVKP
jgi:hypothetical protein